MSIHLSEIEARVIGSLIEKSVVTPDQYPMTLNALTNACNQKSSRNPVMALSQGNVQKAIRQLEEKHLVRTDENFKSRTEKYTQRFCNTPYSDLQFSEAERAVVCLLLLRGAQTPGELRARSGRLYTFADNAEVTHTLDQLMHAGTGALCVKLPKTPGRKDSEYMHLFSGPVDVEAHVEHANAARNTRPANPSSLSELSARVDKLETELAMLKTQLGINE